MWTDECVQDGGGERREDMSEKQRDAWGNHLKEGYKHSRSITIQLLQAEPGRASAWKPPSWLHI